MIEPTIDSYSQDFLENCYSNTKTIHVLINERCCRILWQNYKQNYIRHQKYNKFSGEKCKPKPVSCDTNRNKFKWKFHEKTFTATKVQ